MQVKEKKKKKSDRLIAFSDEDLRLWHLTQEQHRKWTPKHVAFKTTRLTQFLQTI